ncbi:MAG TPA: hypothetical protein VJR89_38665, partial [Polyangiales bacterium]|nr:hypothetical protein [Polyangiales bacterium]
EAKLVVPKGLYWPWSNAMLSRLDDGPRIVQMSLQGPKPVVRSEARECYLDISLLYGPQATEA